MQIPDTQRPANTNIQPGAIRAPATPSCLPLRQKIRALRNWQTLLFGCLLLLCGSESGATDPRFAAAQNNCNPPQSQTTQTAYVQHIIDGDTLVLKDGRHVRLLGINAPELGRKGRKHQPLALAARQALQQLLPAQSPVLLLTGKQPRDRYRRTLAHLYNQQGHSIEQQLLLRGMAFQITIPPNLGQHACLRQAEQYARRHSLGVWGERAYQALPAAQLAPQHQGFQRVTGRVTRTARGRGNLQLELDQRLFVLIRQKNLVHFDAEQVLGLLGQDVELRGWIVARTLSAKQRKRGFKPFMLTLQHPDALNPRD